MSYNKNRDFIAPLENGNKSCNLPLFADVYETGEEFSVRCNLGGMIVAENIGRKVKLSVNQKEEFLRQINNYKFTSAKEVIAVYRIISDSTRREWSMMDWEDKVYPFLSEEELKEIDNIILAKNFGKVSLSEISAKEFVLLSRHLSIECGGGVVNGGISIATPNGETFFDGDYSFRYNRFENSEQNSRMLEVISHFAEEELITKLFVA